MEKEELDRCLQDMQQALASLDKRNESAFRLNTEAKVNSAECLKEVRDMGTAVKHLTDLTKESKSIEQTRQILSKMEGITGNLQLYADSMKEMLRHFPGRVKTEASMHFQGHNRTVFFVITGLILLAALFAGLWSSSWQHDRRLIENDVKYRYLMLQTPGATLQTDSLFRYNPKLFKARLEQMEDYQRVQQQAQSIATQKAKEAQEAGEKMQQLKKRSK